jgi:hypothetical protein
MLELDEQEPELAGVVVSAIGHTIISNKFLEMASSGDEILPNVLMASVASPPGLINAFISNIHLSDKLRIFTWQPIFLNARIISRLKYFSF